MTDLSLLSLLGNLNCVPSPCIVVPDAETILDAADLARDSGFTNPSDRPLIAVIFFALLCLGLWLGNRRRA